MGYVARHELTQLASRNAAGKRGNGWRTMRDKAKARRRPLGLNSCTASTISNKPQQPGSKQTSKQDALEAYLVMLSMQTEIFPTNTRQLQKAPHRHQLSIAGRRATHAHNLRLPTAPRIPAAPPMHVNFNIYSRQQSKQATNRNSSNRSCQPVAA